MPNLCSTSTQILMCILYNWVYTPFNYLKDDDASDSHETMQFDSLVVECHYHIQQPTKL